MGIVRSSSLLLVLAACSDAPTEQPGTPPLSPVIKAQQGTDIYHIVSNGDAAQLYARDGDTGFFVSFFCNTPESAFLGYSIVRWTYNPVYGYWVSEALESGTGTLPCRALTGSGTGQASLHVSTTGDNFTHWVGNGGDIDLVWNKTDGYYSRNTGTTEYRYPEFRYRTSGTSEQSSARVTGTMLGFSINSTDGGFMSKNHSLQVNISRTP